MAFYFGGVALGVGGVAVCYGKESNLHGLFVFRHDDFGLRYLQSVSRQNVRRDNVCAEGTSYRLNNFSKIVCAA